MTILSVNISDIAIIIVKNVDYRCIIQNMNNDEAADDSLVALRLICDWFVTSKMIKELFAALYPDENIVYFNEDSTIIILLFLSEFWLGMLNLKIAKNLSEDK